MTDTFYADIAKYQRVVDSTYPYPLIAFRADSGFDTDPNAEANWAYCQHAAKIQVAIAYVVFIPGATAQILSRIKLLFGQTAPPKLVVMIDMESGGQFAGPGNHSEEANAFVTELVAWTGSRDRVIGYANRYDWADNWPGRPSWMRRVTAAYGTTDPGTAGWQYYGGVDGPTPAGYPRSCPPFGSAVDMNVIHAPIAQILTDFGLVQEDDVTPAQIEAAVVAALQSPAGQAAISRADQLSFHDGAGHQVSIDTELAERLGPVMKGLGLIESNTAKAGA